MNAVVPSRTGHPDRRSLADRILCRLFKRRDIINKTGQLYLRRWYLTPPTWPVRLFLHQIILDDDDRALHNHPWDFASFIMRGEYKEILPLGKSRQASPGTLLRNPAEHTHRVVIVRGPVWTLMISRRAKRIWGFHDPDRGWIDWRTYLDLNGAPDWPEDVVDPNYGAGRFSRLLETIRRWMGSN